MPVTTLLNNAQAVGPGSAMNLAGVNEAAIRITGNFIASILIEATFDGTNWFPYDGRLVGAKNYLQIFDKPATVYIEKVGALYAVRLNVVTYKSGSINATGYTDTGGKDVVLTGRKVKIAKVSVNNTTTVASGTTESTYIYAPAGWCVRAIHAVALYAPPPVGATTGTHMLSLGTGQYLGGGGYTPGAELGIAATVAYNINLQFLTQNLWASTPSGARPAGDSDALRIFNSLFFDDSIPILFKYVNNTDVAQSIYRKADLIVTLEAKVS